MIESIENLEDMKVGTLPVISPDVTMFSLLQLFSGCRKRSDCVSLAAGPHCKGVGVHGGSQARDLQSIQELPEDSC